MSFTCCCTNQCRACGQCCQVDCGHRRSAGTYVSPNTIPYSPPLPSRRALTDDDVRRIIREELARGIGGER